ncbi:MAG: hypothetical protein A2677_04185 [Candidatus Komeilibacteria bacterium RIFCSPHIGHO2_01_FULL_52_14]|uniref:Gfo/Idh/MocA-like oxidoreductase N-terminal domain-containing protein n=1 Tax=Candidatus Komeilibacteria bacterium RIFCSPHIGHO2_01_FULL_52_14 TaxID=1798549 RepID=A0A1G2BNP3_9BACT|nr:MAG: hypothetical protein A2677_04185 [Candidatus Komeilibacteria bacterium RIFCSPHIGHO2_01_FULL_52_14]
MPTKVNTAIVIGAGKIGAGFDSPKSPSILTHAHALKTQRSVRFLGLIDSNRAVGKAAARRWSVPYLGTSIRAVKAGADIVCIATPEQTHEKVFVQTIAWRPKIIVLEKPSSLDTAITKRMARLARQNKVSVAVNYSRAFDPVLRQLRDDVRAGKYGRVISASGSYTKGLLHNGSHMVQLAEYFFGGVLHAIPLHSTLDFTKSDPSISAFLRFDHCDQFYLSAGDARAFALCEFVVLCERARIRYSDSDDAIYIAQVIPDKRYAGFRRLSQERKTLTGGRKVMRHVIESAVRHIRSGVSVPCDLTAAMHAEAICIQLKKQYEKK